MNQNGSKKSSTKKVRKYKDAIVFILVTVIILSSAYILGFGLILPGGNWQIKSVASSLKLGLDLTGGSYVEEEVVGQKPDQDTLQRTQTLIENRVNQLGVEEATVSVTQEGRIRIEVPGVTNTTDLLNRIGQTGELKFVGPDGQTILTGKDVSDATVGVDSTTNAPLVLLKLNADGTKKFADATTKFVGQQISIYMDNTLQSSPTVQEPITGGNAQITGSTSVDDAKRLAGIIKSGALPVQLKPATVQTIGPSLGAEAIPTSAKAAAIGVSLVFLFMLFYYRLPGLIADLALMVYIMLTVLIFNGIGATLTLPGIAGLLLSIGMAVDANVLIFERMKEELRLGKSLMAAIDAGFHRALSSILDSNITTLIAGFALFYFGSGSVKGFALTLILGILCSMFTAITVTRFLLKRFVNTRWVKNTKYYGA